MERTRLSILIHCYNNESTIRDLLENVKWADEIVICDSFSTDKTVDICSEYTDKIYQYEHKNSADQKNWTIPKCKDEWILQIDTDEKLTGELINEIKDLMGRTDIKYEVYKIPRKNHIFGRWARGAGLYLDYQERLFRRDLRFEERPIHACLMIKGDVGILKGHILHMGWENMNDIRQRFKRQRRLLSLQKRQELHRYRFYHLILRPPALFFYLFIIKKGFIDGWRGLFYAGFIALLEFCVLKDLLLNKRPK